jgi:hypothetical protein
MDHFGADLALQEVVLTMATNRPELETCLRTDSLSASD